MTIRGIARWQKRHDELLKMGRSSGSFAKEVFNTGDRNQYRNNQI